MAKEMMIIFVYDTELIKHEEDDPASAILYFHPGWVSDQQRTALCGQLMGTTHFLKSTFTCPKIVALQSGKFSMREYGRYLLAVGTDRNIADWILEYRADTLASLITFFHNDLEAMSAIYQTNETLSAKLYHMFETYLKILTYSSNLFSNLPKIQLPKSASNVFLEAVQILQCCQEVEQVLGGTMLYHNKVVATQLSSNLTKRLVLTDPYRIKSPAEIVDVDFQLPLGVQLLQIYIEGSEYQDLLEDATRTRTVHQYLNKKSYSKIMQPKEQVLSAMKRDQSLIFTTVPEEDSDSHSPINIENSIIPNKPLTRPKFLNLRCKSMEAAPKQPAVTTPFQGQTSICSTPMTELNKVLHQSVMSICKNPDNGVQDAQKVRLPKLPAPKTQYFTVNNNNTIKASGSVSDLNESEDGTTENAMIKYKTIADPTFPVFTTRGKPISEAYYGQYVSQQANILQQMADTQPDVDEWKSIEDFDNISPKKEPAKRCIEFQTPRAQEARKALTLPLKSFSTESESVKSYGGVQLTPLMSKLSLLAMEERSSGFCSRDTTPSEYKDFRFTPTQPNYSFVPRKSSESKFRRPIIDRLKKGVLFVCGQQDMVVALLLEESACRTPEVVKKLWDMCMDSLGRLEKQLRQSLETYPANTSGQSENGEPYSYLSIDQHWDTVQRGGPWGGPELGALTHLHRDFANAKSLTEIVLRDDDSIIYGHHCGKTEVYYMQSVNSNAGLPTPADPMGVVPLKAKRRLERDHAIILL